MISKAKTTKKAQETIFKKISSLQGVYEIPCDEQILQRSLFILAQCVGKAIIHNFTAYENVLATIKCLQALGIKIKRNNSIDSLIIYGVGVRGLAEPKNILDIKSSRIGFSLLTGILATYPFTSVITRKQKFAGNLIDNIAQYLINMGADFLTRESPVIIKGSAYALPESYNLVQSSSLVKAALIMGGLNIKGRTTIIEPFPGSIDHTEIMLKYLSPAAINIMASKETNIITLEGLPEIPAPQVLTIPGSPAIAAFLVAAAILLPSSNIIIKNICLNPTRIKLYKILQRMGASITLEETFQNFGETIGRITASSSQLKGITIKENDISMENYPILLILAAYAKGQTIIESNRPLKLLKSHKISNILANLKKLGVKISHNESQLIIEGGPIKGGEHINVYNDYDTAMSFIMCSFAAEKPINLYNHQNDWFNLFYQNE